MYEDSEQGIKRLSKKERKQKQKEKSNWQRETKKKILDIRCQMLDII